MGAFTCRHKLAMMMPGGGNSYGGVSGTSNFECAHEGGGAVSGTDDANLTCPQGSVEVEGRREGKRRAALEHELDNLTFARRGGEHVERTREGQLLPTPTLSCLAPVGDDDVRLSRRRGRGWRRRGLWRRW